MAAFRMSLLGSFELRRRGKLVRLPTRKAEALLAYLALAHERAHPRDVLTALLWGDAPDEGARASLRQTLFLIGKALERGVIKTEGRTVALARDGLEVDVLEFERCSASGRVDALERAAGLYRGDLLAGIAVDEPSFEEWLVAERERLRERAIDVLAQLVRIYREGADADRAIRAALRLVALDPLEEDARRVLMCLYADTGRRAAALKQYQSCVDALQRELGAEPTAATRALYRDILQQEPIAVSDPGEGGMERFVAAVHAAPERPVHPSSLVGRGAELTGLCDALRRIRDGNGHVALVTGEAGIGKTTLVSAFAAAAATNGSCVLLGRSYESEQILPFAPWVEALQTTGALTDAVVGSLDAVWRAELTRLFPELAAAGLPAPTDDPRRLFESVLRLVSRLAAAGPLVVILEDVHWADEMSMRLLSFLARRIQAQPLMIVATAREEDFADASALRRAVDEMRSANSVTEIALAPLSMSDTAALVRAQMRSDTEARVMARLEEQIWRMSEGNPFVAVETLRAFGQGHVPADASGLLTLPERVREVINRRLERLSASARELASVAAVVGRELDFALLAGASGMGEREAAEAVEELVRRRILHAVGNRFDFTHDHVRQATYGRILAVQRKLLHARIAASLERLHAADLQPHYAALGLHYEWGDAWDKAAMYLHQAGIQAAERSAYREAAQSFERAIEALDRMRPSGDGAVADASRRAWHMQAIELRLSLRNALLPLGEEARIVSCLREAESSTQRLGDTNQYARILSYLCRHLLRVNEYAGALDAGQRALALVTPSGEIDVRVSAHLYLGFVQQLLGDFPAALAHLRNTTRLVGERERERFGLPYFPAVFARTWLAWCLADLGEFDEGFARAREGVELAEAVDYPWDRLVAYYGLGIVHLEHGDHLDAAQLFDRALRLCESTEVAGMHPNMAGHLGYARTLTGDPVEGARLLEEAVAVSGATQSWAQSRLLSFLARTLMLLGKPEAALARAYEALHLARERGERAYEAWALHTVAAVLAPSQAPEAASRYSEALAMADMLGMQPLVAHCRRSLRELG